MQPSPKDGRSKLVMLTDAGRNSDSMQFDQPWDTPGSSNAKACSTTISVFRCSSAASPRKLDVKGFFGFVGVVHRLVIFMVSPRDDALFHSHPWEVKFKPSSGETLIANFPVMVSPLTRLFSFLTPSPGGDALLPRAAKGHKTP